MLLQYVPVPADLPTPAPFCRAAIFQRKRNSTYMVLRPHGDLRRDIKAVRGTVRYELLSGHLQGTGVPSRTRGTGAFVVGSALEPRCHLLEGASAGP